MNAWREPPSAGRPRRPGPALLAAGLLVALAAALAMAGEAPIDWSRARQLHRRDRQGEQLSPEDRAYLERARRERRERMSQQTPQGERTGLVPLIGLGEGGYKGEDGGLYGGGLNTPPGDLLAAALEAARRVVPLDARGVPSPDGSIVLLSVGMSNTSQEFAEFKRIADGDPGKSAGVVIVDGAQGGRDASDWARPPELFRTDRPSPWSVAGQRLREAGVTPEQVQVIWLKQARAGPAALGEFPAHARALQADLGIILGIAARHYPNLRLVYLSSRIYAGYATTPLNPEPYAYESAFAVRWAILDRIAARPEADDGDEPGGADAPTVLWGPYLWADGLTPREPDGLVWEAGDLGQDGTHPSMPGRRKVAGLLLEFFKTDSTARPWFATPAGQTQGEAGR